jgi:hypothetical protein
MSNLLEETKAAITASGHSPTDIVFIGSADTGHACSWDEFCALADVEYDAGYGSVEVATDLRIVFADGQQMWRGEYDGSEWWEYSEPFLAPGCCLPITRLVGSGWRSLESLNTIPKEEA